MSLDELPNFQDFIYKKSEKDKYEDYDLDQYNAQKPNILKITKGQYDKNFDSPIKAR